ncbi:MAG: hypothetical protein NTV20_01795, partial [Candidatus Shapirobacteria bacterium]|nr:hypothetical protein [Candidatus Shapirobacteria bacterium]
MNWKKLLKILGFFLFLIIIGLWLRSNFWQIAKIDCQFNQLNCNDEIKNKISEFSLNKNILFFSRQTLIKKIKENFPQIDSIEIKKRIPDKLSFSLTSRKPVVALAVELAPDLGSTVSGQLQFSLTGVYYLVDEEGVVVKKMEESQNLPLILFNHDPQLKNGEKITQEEVQKTIEILMGMKLRLLEPKVSRPVSFREIEIWLENEVLVLFSGQKDISVQLDSLQFISSRSKIEG